MLLNSPEHVSCSEKTHRIAALVKNISGKEVPELLTSLSSHFNIWQAFAQLGQEINTGWQLERSLTSSNLKYQLAALIFSQEGHSQNGRWALEYYYLFFFFCMLLLIFLSIIRLLNFLQITFSEKQSANFCSRGEALEVSGTIPGYHDGSQPRAGQQDAIQQPPCGRRYGNF